LVLKPRSSIYSDGGMAAVHRFLTYKPSRHISALVVIVMMW